MYVQLYKFNFLSGKTLEFSSGKKRYSKTPENVTFDKQKMLLEVRSKPKGSTVSKSIWIQLCYCIIEMFKIITF